MINKRAKHARAGSENILRSEFLRHIELSESEPLSVQEKKSFDRLLYFDRCCDDDSLGDSLRVLSELPEKHCGQKVGVLIDEYDVPLDKANFYG